MSQTLNSPATTRESRFVPPLPERSYNSADVVKLTGATYRQLDHWTTKGHLVETANGSGTYRTYTATDLDTVFIVVRLMRFGIELGRAFEIARALVTEDRYSVVLGDVFELTVHVRIPEPAPPT